jgi:hypothetical protein
VPGNFYAELTYKDKNVERHELQVILYEIKGGPVIANDSFAIHQAEYIVVIGYPLRSAQQLELRLNGQRFW